MNALALDTTKHAVQAEPREAAAPDHHEFKHQLEKAKPAKKAAEPTAPSTPTPALALQDPTTLAQILAALLNGAAKDAPTVPDTQLAAKALATSEADATATVQAAATATAQLAAGAPDKLVQQSVASPAAEPPLTPLEQAVHDLLSELADKKAPASDASTAATFQLAPSANAVLAPESTPDVQPAAAVAPAPPPAELVSQNHAHLVLDDGNGRVVLTVAVRGNEVNVSVRSADDSTAAALARNAASLDDAMRGRGLQLAQFDAQRDLAREQHAEKPKYERETVKKSNAERFTLEENQ